MWSAIPLSWKIGGIAVIVASLIAGYAFWHHRVYQQGVDATTAASLKSAITIREKQNEIRDRRPDTDALVRRLRAGQF